MGHRIPTMSRKPDIYSLGLGLLTPDYPWKKTADNYASNVGNPDSGYLQTYLREQFGIDTRISNGMLIFNAADGQRLKSISPQKLKSPAAFREALAEIKSRDEPPPPPPPLDIQLSEQQVIDGLSHYTKLPWGKVNDASSALNGEIATAPVGHKLAEQQQRVCTQKGLDTTIITAHDKSALVARPDAAEKFVRKKLEKSQAANGALPGFVTRTAGRDDIALS